MCCVQVPLHLTVCDTLINQASPPPPVSLLRWGRCVNSSVFTEHIQYPAEPVVCAARGATSSAYSLRLCSTSITRRKGGRSVSSCFQFFQRICQKRSLSLPRKSIPAAPCGSGWCSGRQMLMNDRQRSKLVMDTFMSRAPDPPDCDVCFLATGSHQISGGCQLKSAGIIS